MARTTLAGLIAKVRRLVDDKNATIWNADEVQDALDRRRMEAVQIMLASHVVRVGSSSQRLIYTAPYGDWEGGVTLYDATFAAVSADAEDLTVGRWSFTSEPNYPIYLSGFTFDVYAAAADLLEERAQQLVGQYDFSADGGNYRRSQHKDGLVKLAEQYRRQQRPQVGRLIRDDLVR